MSIRWMCFDWSTFGYLYPLRETSERFRERSMTTGDRALMACIYLVALEFGTSKDFVVIFEAFARTPC